MTSRVDERKREGARDPSGSAQFWSLHNHQTFSALHVSVPSIQLSSLAVFEGHQSYMWHLSGDYVTLRIKRKLSYTIDSALPFEIDLLVRT